MLFKIFHAKQPTFGFGKQPEFPEEYEAVAVVQADYIGDTFRITNHIEDSWTKNSEVQELLVTNPRSTSVGDVVEVGIDSGDFYRCENVGWEKMKLNA